MVQLPLGQTPIVGVHCRDRCFVLLLCATSELVYHAIRHVLALSSVWLIRPLRALETISRVRLWTFATGVPSSTGRKGTCQGVEASRGYAAGSAWLRTCEQSCHAVWSMRLGKSSAAITRCPLGPSEPVRRPNWGLSGAAC